MKKVVRGVLNRRIFPSFVSETPQTAPHGVHFARKNSVFEIALPSDFDTNSLNLTIFYYIGIQCFCKEYRSERACFFTTFQRQPWMLHEYHEGKGSASKSIAAKNAGIRAYNACIAFLISKGVDAPQTLKTLYRAAQTDLQAGLPPRVHSELWANLNAQKTVEALCRQAMQLHEGHRKGTLAQRLEQAKQEAMQRNMQRIQQQRNDLDISR